MENDCRENPCKPDCPRRSATCHSTCEDYAGFARACEIRRKEQYMAKMLLPTSNAAVENSKALKRAVRNKYKSKR